MRLLAQPIPWPSGLAVASARGRGLPGDAVLVARLVATRCATSTSPSPAPIADEVLANRGLAGIDGVVVHGGRHRPERPPRPTYALLGDLTFLHDANGLAHRPRRAAPDLTVVVVNDDGGGIFTHARARGPRAGRRLRARLRHPHRDRPRGTVPGTRHPPRPGGDGGATCRGASREPPRGIRVVEVPVDRGTHRQAHADLRALPPAPSRGRGAGPISARAAALARMSG